MCIIPQMKIVNNCTIYFSSKISLLKKKKTSASLSQYLAFFDNDPTDLRLFLNIHDLCRKDWAQS